MTIITRMGSGKLQGQLPKLIQAVEREGREVVWSCDPMHANTVKSDNGYKTRRFDAILEEVRAFFAIHSAEGSHAGGDAEAAAPFAKDITAEVAGFFE